MNRRLWIAAVIILGALGFLVFQGLGNATVFFRTADEAVAQRDSLGNRRFRVEGVVVDEPVERDGELSFQIESDGVRLPVVHRGDPRELFKKGIPVVLEGRWAGAHYASDRIMVKHSESYRVDNPERVKDYPAEGE